MEAERRRELTALMIRFADGDRSAFKRLFDGLWPVLLAFTTRTLPSRADAEDAAQQALLKVFSRSVDFDRERDALSWALAITGYEVMTVRKQRQRRREADGDELGSVQDPAPTQEEQIMADDLRAAVRAVLGELPEHDQAALAFAFTGDAAPTDDTSRKRRLRALERLRAAWRKLHG
ncbi:RNA polymerase sigma factor [Sorangium cellulosum]|uniref:RNA polymerase sigma factor n=1 Tax=Sorangium cellulosum TaxID=56 RepID=UPI003D9A72E7